MNKPQEKLHLPATDSTPKPGEFPLGSLESRAATRAMIEQMRAEARRVLEERESSEVHCHFVHCDGGGVCTPCECERCKQGLPHGPNDINVQFIDVGGDVPQRRPDEKEVHEPAAFDEKKPEAVPPAADAEPQEPEPQRVPLVEARRRPFVRPLMRGRRAWPPSALGA